MLKHFFCNSIFMLLGIDAKKGRPTTLSSKVVSCFRLLNSSADRWPLTTLCMGLFKKFLVEGTKQILNIVFGSDTRKLEKVWELCLPFFVEKATN